jgi:plastocyanin
MWRNTRMNARHVIRGLVATIVVGALVAAACGSDSKKSNTPAAGGTTAATKPTAASTPAAGATKRTEVDTLNATAKDFAFTLDLTSVHPGPPGVDVTFKNDGATTHTLTFYEDSGFTKQIGGSGNIAAGQTGGFPFLPPSGASKVYYRCDIHTTQMKGELAVKP